MSTTEIVATIGVVGLWAFAMIYGELAIRVSRRRSEAIIRDVLAMYEAERERQGSASGVAEFTTEGPECLDGR